MKVTGDVVKHAQNLQCCTVQSVILSRPHGISMISERPNIKTKGIQEDGHRRPQETPEPVVFHEA